MNNNNEKRNAEDAKAISLDLKDGTEINQKMEYYKSILKAYDDLSSSIGKKIALLNDKLGADIEGQGADGLYEKSQ